MLCLISLRIYFGGVVFDFFFFSLRVLKYQNTKYRLLKYSIAAAFPSQTIESKIHPWRDSLKSNEREKQNNTSLWM